MFDVALRSAGASVVIATSSDDKFPPDNIIDGLVNLMVLIWASTAILIRGNLVQIVIKGSVGQFSRIFN